MIPSLRVPFERKGFAADGEFLCAHRPGSTIQFRQFGE